MPVDNNKYSLQLEACRNIIWCTSKIIKSGQNKGGEGYNKSAISMVWISFRAQFKYWMIDYSDRGLDCNALVTKRNALWGRITPPTNAYLFSSLASELNQFRRGLENLWKSNSVGGFEIEWYYDN